MKSETRLDVVPICRIGKSRLPAIYLAGLPLFQMDA
jgi:hypothetical protein